MSAGGTVHPEARPEARPARGPAANRRVPPPRPSSSSRAEDIGIRIVVEPGGCRAQQIMKPGEAGTGQAHNEARLPKIVDLRDGRDRVEESFFLEGSFSRISLDSDRKTFAKQVTEAHHP